MAFLSGCDQTRSVATESAVGAGGRRWAPTGWLTPVPPDRRWRRFTQLLLGLALYGVTMAVMVRAGLGLDPWDVFHQGLSRILPLSFGTVVICVSVVVLLLWIPLRQRPGVGTLANVVLIGLVTDATLALVPQVQTMWVRIAMLVAAVVGNALAGALYLGAGMGPGSRDGLMTGLVARGIGTVRLVRTAIEVTVLAIGWALGGTFAVGTVLYALTIGPLLHLFMPIFAITPRQHGGDGEQ